MIISSRAGLPWRKPCILNDTILRVVILLVIMVGLRFHSCHQDCVFILDMYLGDDRYGVDNRRYLKQIFLGDVAALGASAVDRRSTRLRLSSFCRTSDGLKYHSESRTDSGQAVASSSLLHPSASIQRRNAFRSPSLSPSRFRLGRTSKQEITRTLSDDTNAGFHVFSHTIAVDIIDAIDCFLQGLLCRDDY